MELLLNFAEEHFGLAFVTGVILVAAVLCGIVWLTIWIVKFTSGNRDLKSKIDSLPCPEHARSLVKHSDVIGEINSSLNRIDGQVDFLVRLATSKPADSFAVSSSTFSEKKSPRKLNNNGNKLLAEVRGDEFLQENGRFFLDEIAKLEPKTALDVENYALSVLLANSERQEFNRLKNWVNNASSLEITDGSGSVSHKDISMEDVLFVLSIPLRDRYLAGHPEVSVQ